MHLTLIIAVIVFLGCMTRKLYAQKVATSKPTALLGEVVCNGPHGEDDFTDNRQWVQVKKIIVFPGLGAYFPAPSSFETDQPSPKA